MVCQNCPVPFDEKPRKGPSTDEVLNILDINKKEIIVTARWVLMQVSEF